MRSHRTMLLCAALVLVAPQAAEAQNVFGAAAPPPPVLVVTPDGTRSFTVDDLAALGNTRIDAVTPWTEGVVSFAGPPFAALAREMGIEDATVVMEALNDYRIEEPLAALIEDGAVLALEVDGVALPLHTHGPVWLTFPSAADRRLSTSAKMYRWIWQIGRITFLPDAAAPAEAP